MTNMELDFACGDTSFSVHHFRVEEEMNGLFQVALVAHSPHEDLDLSAFVDAAARLRLTLGSIAGGSTRVFAGIVRAMHQVRVEPNGLSTYEISLVPALWALSQRRDSRLFLHRHIPDIVEEILGSWGIAYAVRLDRRSYPQLELRVQYDESDLDFIRRLLEEAGISTYFEEDPDKGAILVLHDRPESSDLRPGPPLPYVDEAFSSQSGGLLYVTRVRVGEEVRPGRVTGRDEDPRRPAFPLFASSPPADKHVAPQRDAQGEARYEQYRYEPGSFLIDQSAGEAASPMPTPVADDLGAGRHVERWGSEVATRRLASLRAGKRQVSFETSALDLRPGSVMAIAGHPRGDLAPTARLLVVRSVIEGEHTKEWRIEASAVFAGDPYRPARRTRKPRIWGVQSALVVGPAGEEIHTDELGRVRAQLQWDREGKSDPHASVWIRVSQGWAGGGYGLFTVPRVGHEVLVAYLDGDPDCPIIVGRVFNGTAQVPYKLPENKTVSTLRTASSPASGGFNELRFEDAQGREHVYLQAEKDLDQLVKHDEMSAVGHDLRRVVQNDESITVGRDRTKVVHFNEHETTGLHRSSVTGVNRSAVVGASDSTLVGARWSVSMARGLAGSLPRELGRKMKGALGPLLGAPIASVLGTIPIAPLGGLAGEGELVRGPLSLLSRLAPDTFRNILGIAEGFLTDPGPPPTSIEMVDRKITLSTGEASIVLDGPNVTISAAGNILLHARKHAALLGDEEAAVAAEKRVLVHSRSESVIVQGAPDIHLNPHTGSEEAPAPPKKPVFPPLESLAKSCVHCGGPLIDHPEGQLCHQVLAAAKAVGLDPGVLSFLHDDDSEA